MYNGMSNSFLIGCLLKWPWLIPVLAIGIPVFFWPDVCEAPPNAASPSAYYCQAGVGDK